MKKSIFFVTIQFALNCAFGQSSTLIEPNGNNGIFSQNWTTVIAGPGSVTPPVSGTGTRLMWIPRKSAFRVGTVEGTEWDAANIGTWSTAFGYGTIASGGGSMSIGIHTTASGSYSTSMGYGTTASGDFSTTMGYSTTASGNYSTSIGFGTTAQSFASLVLGRNNVVSGNTTSWVVTDPLFVVGNGADNANRNNALTVLKNGQVGIGTTTISANEIMEINGRMRLRRGTFASGLWFNNSANGTTINDGAFIGLNNETAGSETAGFWLNGAFRWFVDRNGSTTQNSATISNLAGTGTREVYADANGTLTAASASAHTLLLLPNNFVLNSNDETTYVAGYNSPSIGAKIYNSGLNNSSFEGQLSLPNGAVVTNVTFFYFDNTSPNIRFVLSRDSFEDNSSYLNYVDVTSSGSANTNQSISTNTNFTITENKIYSMSITNTGGSAWDVNLRFRGVKITYTL